MIWVIDASVAVRWLIEDETHPHADSVLEALLGMPEMFAVPELFAFEVFAVLLRIHPNGIEAYEEGIIPLLHAGLLRQPMTERMANQASRYVRKGLTGYDACYAALAEDLQGTWLTFDGKAHRRIVADNVSHLLTDKMPMDWPE